MVALSEILIANPQFVSFAQVVATVKAVGEDGERFFQPDIKPDFPDTPRNWEDVLEAAFIWGNR